MDFKSKLIDGTAKLGVWGCGYIGFTTMINFAKEGVYSVGYDTNKSVVEKITSGECHIPNLDFWIGYHISDLVRKMMMVTTDWEAMLSEDIEVHLIAVPTEKDGEPWFGPLRDVIDKLSQRNPTPQNPDLIMIESTLTPGMFDEVVVKGLETDGRKVGREFMVGIAPRRDWFDSPEKNLKALNRVIGGTTQGATKSMKEVLGIVCDHLITTDAGTVELVKSVENSIFHICAIYACQLALAYPDRDITEVLRLASTHWRIPLYFPSMGIGGYCIGVSSKYIRDGTPLQEHLGLTLETIRATERQPSLIADMMSNRVHGNIAVLGISYKRDLKVHALSPALGIIKRLKELGVAVKVFDPYYTAGEIQEIVGSETFQYPDELGKFTGIIIVTPHRIFGQTTMQELFGSLKKGQAILDNEGIWAKWREEFIKAGINYHRVGDKGWCL